MKPGAFIQSQFRPLAAAMAAALLLAGAGLCAADSVPAVLATVSPAAPAMTVLTEAAVAKLLTAELQQDYVKDRGELELSLTEPWSAPRVPDQPLSVKVLEAPTGGVAPFFIVRFQLCTPQATIGTYQTSVRAHVWRDAWVAHSNLRCGEPLAGADVTRDRFDVLAVHEAPADFTAGDPSLEIAEPVPAGSPVLARMVKARAVIHRGQTATALLQDGALSITTKVQALEDGAPGQMIRARNPISQHNLTGKVIDAETILISL